MTWTALSGVLGHAGVRSVLAILAAFSLVAVCQAASVAGRPAERPAAQLARIDDLAPGSLLVAARDLADPNFSRTVVVLLDHDEGGTVGLVVNRQTDVPLSRAFEGLPQGQGQSLPVYVGGPVSIAAVQALVRSTKAVADARHVTEDLYVIRTREPLEARLRGTPDPLRFRVYLGYAGWAAGQLAGEIRVGAWHVFPPNVDVVFDADPATVWQRKIRQTEVLLARVFQLLERPSPVFPQQPRERAVRESGPPVWHTARSFASWRALAGVTARIATTDKRATPPA
jgi:putative transcriptional regulator